MTIRALVTGGSGFFGTALARRLKAAGALVRVFDLNAPEEGVADEFIQGDIRDAQAVAKACAGVGWVFHAVAQVPLARDAAAFWSVNRDGTANLLNGAANARKIVYISSSAVYGVPASNPVNENTPPSPAEDYGAAKLAAEKLCGESGLDVTIIRPRTILGPGRLGIFQALFEWARLGRNLPVLGDGSNRYQFVHAEDLAEACFLAAGRAGATSYNCGAEKFGTMKESLKALCVHAAKGSQIRRLPKRTTALAMRVSGALGLTPLAPYHALMYGESLFFDIAKAREELGWRPRWSNEGMLIQSYDWYIANRLSPRKGSSPHRSGVKPGLLALAGRLL